MSAIFTEKESQVQSYARHFPVVFTEAKGAWLIDEERREYLDFLSGAGALNYGHNPIEMQTALVSYITQNGVTHGLDLYTKAKREFLQCFDQYILSPRQLDYRLQFTGPTGTNAVEAAMKLARKVTGRHNIVAFTNGYHGMTAGALAATGNQHHRKGAGMPLSGITRLPFEGYPNVDSLAYFSSLLVDGSSGLDKPAAVILETVQGEGGLNVASDAWLQGISALCKAHDILLIVDDVQAGCGRTGTFFSFEPSGIVPDMVTLSKSISGYGLPLGLVLIKPSLDQWLPGEHNGTYRGNNHAFVTAKIAIETYWKNTDFQNIVAQRSMQLRDGLDFLLASFPKLFVRVKGRGLMTGIECQNEAIASQLQARCFELGLVIETAGPKNNVLKCFCPLTIKQSELALGLTLLQNALHDLDMEPS